MSQYGVSFVATVYAWDTSAGSYKTGDSANITLYWTKDGTQSVTTNSCSEVSSTNAPGQYKVTLTATEAQCTAGTLGGKSSTSGIIIIPAQFTFEQYPTNFSSLSIDGNGRVDVIKLAGTTQTARDIGASVLLSSGTGTGQLNFTSGVVQADAAKVGGQTASAAGTVTFPGTIASSTNITGGTITTVTSVTNGVTLAANAVDSTAIAATGAQEIADAVTANATAAPLAVNLKKINGVTVNGDGSGTPWGP